MRGFLATPFVLLGPYLGALALPTSEGINHHVLHEKRSGHVHSSWMRGERVETDAIVPVRIGLKQNNLEHGAERLLAVSHPHSPEFGKHLSAEEVHDLFAPSGDAVEAVREWLVSAGVDTERIVHSDNKGWLAVDVPATQAEELFKTELYEYEHTRSGSLRLGCDDYHVPAHIQHHIDYITPGVKLSSPLKKRTKRSSTSGASKANFGHRPHQMPTPSHHWSPPAAAHTLPADLQACGVNITPPCLRALYGLPVNEISDDVNSLGLYEQGDYYAQQDIDLFFANIEKRVPNGTHPVLKGIDGGYAPLAPNNPNVGGESDIDIDITISLIYPQTVTLYQVDDYIYAPEEVALDNTFNTFLDALDGSYCSYSAYGITGDSGKDPVYPDPAAGGYKGQLQCGVYTPTRVISASYGESEGDFPKNYVERQCNEFMKLGLQGHSIFFSSSDFGVGNFPDDPDANGCRSGFGQNETVFNPDYPVGCPWVTAVGATMLYADQTVEDQESAMAVDLYAPGDSEAYKYFSSAGGFSNYFEPAAYQKATVDEYFANHNPGYPTYVANANATNVGINGGRFNRAGRGYPDVSANGAYMLAYVGEELGSWFGTSLASPIWASVATLLNQQRTLKGKGPIGFVNPTLYAHPELLNDIVNGSNPNCFSAGFSAVSGWDPVTGLGTPNYPKLLEYYLSLP